VKRQQGICAAEGVSGGPFLTHNPFPTATPSISPLPIRDLIHFATTEAALIMFVVGDTTPVPIKITGLHQNLKLVFVVLKNFLNCFSGFK
jgi:hypothetical protein